MCVHLLCEHKFLFCMRLITINQFDSTTLDEIHLHYSLWCKFTVLQAYFVILYRIICYLLLNMFF